MNISTSGIPKAGLPEGFAYLDECIEDCIIDAKYYGTDNFMGCPADGYEQPLVVVSRPVAEACVKAAELLRKRGYLMKVFDGYRPQRAVEHFIRWAEDPADTRRKPLYYPFIDKKDVFKLGYIAKQSKHTSGAAIDVTLVDMRTFQELDVGAGFDFMAPRSHVDTTDISPAQEQNRRILRDAMLASGFDLYPYEWWHFNLKDEPYPGQFFDFPVR
jgi:D-alanyl-D-alanine dipeptidase